MNKIVVIDNEAQTITEGSLVMIRRKNNDPNSILFTHTWWRVMFIDLDETFVGKLERHHWRDYTAHKKDDTERFEVKQIEGLYKEGQQFCYGDNITICDCPGLCRNK